MEFIYNDEFSNWFIKEDNGDGFAVAIERKVRCDSMVLGGREGGIDEGEYRGRI